MKTILRSFLVSVAFLLVAGTVAQAHILPNDVHGFGSGFAHPLHGLDHILVMVAVGLSGGTTWRPGALAGPGEFRCRHGSRWCAGHGGTASALHGRRDFAFGFGVGGSRCCGRAFSFARVHGDCWHFCVFSRAFAWCGDASQCGWLRLRWGFHIGDHAATCDWHRARVRDAYRETARGAVGRRGDCRGGNLSLGILTGVYPRCN